jgi:hypothetical protein
MLLAVLAAPAAAHAQYGAWSSGRAAGTTYKQAQASSGLASMQKHGAATASAFTKHKGSKGYGSKGYGSKGHGSKSGTFGYGGKSGHGGAAKYGGPTKAYGKSSYGAPKAYGGYSGPGGFHGYKHPAPRRVWVAGHWALREQKVWVAGRTERVWRPARFETRYDACGIAFSVQVQAGHYETIQHPGSWEWRTQRVWVPGGWSSAH